MTKSFFDLESEAQTAAALQFSNEVNEALAPIIKKWAEQGYSLRQMDYLVIQEATCLTLDALLGKD